MILPPASAGRGSGLFKVAFSWAFFYIYHDISYQDAMYDILFQGGDTDANAAIVGGLLGARWGLSSPKELKWMGRMLAYDYQTCKKGIERPEFLRPHNQLESLIEKATANAPLELKIKCNG